MVTPEKGGFIILTVAGKPGEYVVINGNIVVKVISNDNEELQLEIDAPNGVEIIPGETCKEANLIPPRDKESSE